MKRIVELANEIIDRKMLNLLSKIVLDECIDEKIENRFLKEIMVDKLLDNDKRFYPKIQDIFFMDMTRRFVSWNYTKSELIKLYSTNQFIKSKVDKRIEFFDEVDECTIDSISEHVSVVICDYLESAIKNNTEIYMKVATLVKLKSLNEYLIIMLKSAKPVEDSLLDIDDLISSRLEAILKLIDETYELKDCEQLAIDNYRKIYAFNKN